MKKKIMILAFVFILCLALPLANSYKPYDDGYYIHYQSELEECVNTNCVYAARFTPNENTLSGKWNVSLYQSNTVNSQDQTINVTLWNDTGGVPHKILETKNHSYDTLPYGFEDLGNFSTALTAGTYYWIQVQGWDTTGGLTHAWGGSTGKENATVRAWTSTDNRGSWTKLGDATIKVYNNTNATDYYLLRPYPIGSATLIVDSDDVACQSFTPNETVTVNQIYVDVYGYTQNTDDILYYHIYTGSCTATCSISGTYQGSGSINMTEYAKNWTAWWPLPLRRNMTFTQNQRYSILFNSSATTNVYGIYTARLTPGSESYGNTTDRCGSTDDDCTNSATGNAEDIAFAFGSFIRNYNASLQNMHDRHAAAGWTHDIAGEKILAQNFIPNYTTTITKIGWAVLDETYFNYDLRYAIWNNSTAGCDGGSYQCPDKIIASGTITNAHALKVYHTTKEQMMWVNLNTPVTVMGGERYHISVQLLNQTTDAISSSLRYSDNLGNQGLCLSSDNASSWSCDNFDFLGWAVESNGTISNYSNSQNNTYTKQPTRFNVTLAADNRLDSYRFSIDNCSGAYTNDSWAEFDKWGLPLTSTISVVKKINATAGCTINWKVFANDSAGKEIETSVYTFTTLSSDPTWSNAGQNVTNATNVDLYEHVAVSAQWNDNNQLDNWWFYNGTHNMSTASFSAGNWSNTTWNTTGLTKGTTYTLKIYANDTGDNEIRGPVWQYIIDNTIPTFSSVGSNTTNKTTINKHQGISIFGQWNDNVRLDMYWYETNGTGSYANQTALSFSTGNWSNITVDASSYTAFPFIIRVFTNDTSNNEDPIVYEFNSDTTAPTFTNTHQNVTNGSTLALNKAILLGDQWNDNMDLDKYWIEDGGSNLTAASFSAGNWTNATINISATRTVRIFANDTSGNEAKGGVWSYILDGTNPTFSNAGSNVTNNTATSVYENIALSLQWSDNIELDKWWFYNGTHNMTTASFSAGNWSNSTWNTSGLTIGNDYYPKFYANDTSGNDVQGGLWKYTIDSTSPTTVTYGQNTTNASAILWGADISLYVQWSENVQIDNWWLYNGTDNVTAGTFSAGNWSNTTWNSSTFTAGSYTLRLYANDTSGNENYVNWRYTIDNTTPKFAEPFVPSNASVQGSSNVAYQIRSNESGYAWYNLNNTGNSTATATNASGTWSGLNDGNHNVTYYINDTAGNENSTYIEFVVNASYPDATITKPTGTYASTTVDIEITFDEACYVYYSTNGWSTNNTICPTYSKCTEFTGTMQRGDGTYTFNLYYEDTAGNSRDDDFTEFTVSIPGAEEPSAPGGGGVECADDDDCDEGYICEDGECILKTCGDGYCGAEIGEDMYTCPEDCLLPFTIPKSTSYFDVPVFAGGEIKRSIEIRNPNNGTLTLNISSERIKDNSFEWSVFNISGQEEIEEGEFTVPGGTPELPGRADFLVKVKVPEGTPEQSFEFHIHIATVKEIWVADVPFKVRVGGLAAIVPSVLESPVILAIIGITFVVIVAIAVILIEKKGKKIL